MNLKALTAELFGTFMLMTSVLGAAFYSFSGFTGAAGVLGVALSIGITVMALLRSIGHISGGHYNPAVTLGLVAGGRFALNDAPPYIIAQCLGALLSCALFYYIGSTGATFAANGYGNLSMINAGMVPAFLVEVVLTMFFLIVIMGATRPDAPSGFAPLAVGLSLTAIHIIAIPITNASVNPARSLGSAVFAGGEPLAQVWLFWAAPIIGAILGALLYNWMVAGED